MIDFHSHVLPAIDDGSRNTRMSVQMLSMLREQGCDLVCATPHFYATQRTPQHFLERREEAWQLLQAELPPDAPEIRLGAEVLYYPGINRMQELKSLCLQGTNILLLEMPFEPWSEHAVREVQELAHSGDYCILMAHIERYYFQQPRRVWEDFLDLGVITQSNPSFFLNWRTKGKALKLLREGTLHLLSSDAHNVSERAPRMDEAAAVIRKRLGDEALDEMDRLGRKMLEACAV